MSSGGVPVYGTIDVDAVKVESQMAGGTVIVLGSEKSDIDELDLITCDFNGEVVAGWIACRCG
jgi:hypothetical protein